MRNLTRALAAAATVALAFSPAALSQGAKDFPNKPISLIVPWNAGGSTDIYFRAMADVVAKELGQPVVIDNKTGATGTLGPSTMALTAKPDGYTLAQIPVTVMRLPMMQKHAWDAQRDFSYVIHLTGYTFGVTAKKGGKFKEWKDVVDYAMTMVPFKGGTETNAAILGGHVDLQADSTVWRPLVESGDLILLNVWTESRNKAWPNVPTLKELGYPFVFDSPFGIAGPKGMDPAIVKKLHDAFLVALRDPKVKDIMEKYDFTERYLGPEDYKKLVADYIVSERETLETLEKLGLLKKD